LKKKEANYSFPQESLAILFQTTSFLTKALREKMEKNPLELKPSLFLLVIGLSLMVSSPPLCSDLKIALF